MRGLCATRKGGKRGWLVMLVVLSFAASLSWAAAPDAEKYVLANRAAKQKQKDFAYMHFKDIVELYPQSPYRASSLLAVGEYCYLLPDLRRAKEIFEIYLQENPESKAKLFVLAHLYHIAVARKDDEQVKRMRREILAFRRTGLVFKDFAEQKYLSPLNQRFKAHFHIDKIKFYADDKLFLQVDF